MDKKQMKYKATAENSQYLDLQWKERRKEILEIDGNRCKRCKSEQGLEVHHLKYIRGKKLWEYGDSDLITLCESCHEEVHHYKNEINKSLIAQMKFWCHGIDDSYYDTMQAVRHFESMNAEQISNVVQLCASFTFDKEAF